MKWLLIFSLGFLTLGCSDHMISKVQPNEQDILVHPEHIDFGHLVSGEESGSDTFAVINAGDHELTIMAPVLVSGNNRFSFLVEEGEYVIEEGELMDFEVGYIPETFESNGAYIEIISDDPDEPVVHVTLEGHGDAPVISVDPLEFDYGSISIGCDNEERITIGNDGNLPLTVESVTQMVTQPVDILMEFGALPEPPWTIDPGFELDFLVSYIPTDTGLDSSEIEIVSNDPQTPFIETIQYGDGDVEQWVNDQFEQEEIPLLDILWVIDNSGSMGVIQSHVANNMAAFMPVFLAATPDFHMGFITTDSAAFSGGYYLDTSTVDPETEASTIVNGIGTYGSGYEKGIEYAYESTNSSSYAGPGSTFLRDDATLVIIFVSDEPDYSTGGWSNYTTHFSALKDPDRLHMVSIIGDYPSGCTYNNGSYTRTIQHGSGYYDITNYFGGDVLSICATDWGLQMEDLAETVSSRRTFALSEADPIEDTIEVYVNGQLVTGTWTYDPTDNDVTFNAGEEPEPGDTIEVVYATWGCGE